AEERPLQGTCTQRYERARSEATSVRFRTRAKSRPSTRFQGDFELKIREIASVLGFLAFITLPNVKAQVDVQVDLSKPQGPYPPIYRWFGYDESNYTTMKYGKQLLGELHDLSPEPVYIRAHHLLTSDNGVAELKWSRPIFFFSHHNAN